MAQAEIAQVKTGTLFHYTHADSRPQWRVVKPRGAGTWECVVTEDDLDWAGTRKVFGSEEIARALSMDAFWERTARASQDFWASRRVGEIVHYHEGFGLFFRLRIVSTPQGFKGVPIAMVGKIIPNDRPRRGYTGAVIGDRYAKRLAEAEPMSPHESHMYESDSFSRKGLDDPRTLEPIDFTPPEPSIPDCEAMLLDEVRSRLQAALQPQGGFQTSTEYASALRACLEAAKAILADV